MISMQYCILFVMGSMLQKTTCTTQLVDQNHLFCRSSIKVYAMCLGFEEIGDYVHIS